MPGMINLLRMGVPLQSSGAAGPQTLTIPQWETLSSTLREDFENVAEWSVIAGSTPTQDVTNFRTGSASVRITNSGANTNIQKTVNFSLSGAQGLSFDVYKHGESVGAFSVFVYLSADAGFNKYLNTNVVSIKAEAQPGWYHFDFDAADVQLTGGMTWNDTAIRMRVFVTGNTTDVSVDNFCTNVATTRQPMALFTFDDGYDNCYTTAYPVFAAHGLHATVYVITNLLNGAGKLTTAQTLEMQAGGWTIGSHTADHFSLTTLTEAQQEAQLSEADADLTTLGLTGGKHVAYPVGAYNADTMTAMAATGMITGRTVEVGYNRIGVTPLHLLRMQVLNASVSLATAKGYVDVAVTTNKTLIFLAHGIVSGTPVNLEWNVNDLAELIAYCRSQSLPLVSMEEYYALLSQDVTVPA